MMDKYINKKIAVGLSGGVDSSVALWLLKQQGYDVFALFMQNWHDTTGTLHGECEWEEELQVAKMVAKKVDVPFHFVDLSKEYRKQVVDYMFDEYDKGRTPNPDVLCNSKIKFAAFLRYAKELGADYVATGHYCQQDEFVDANGKSIYKIISGTDKNKDQTYFLCQLTQEQLSMSMFPIGHLCKPEVRKIAAAAGLPSADKKDSQGICFVGKVDLPIFLQQKLKAKEGRVIEIFKDFYDHLEGYPGYAPNMNFEEESHQEGRDIIMHAADVNADSKIMADKQNSNKYNDFSLEKNDCISENSLCEMAYEYEYKSSDGKDIGKHFGAQFFTIGQRKGLNIGGHKESIFVIHTDIKNNLIYVGQGHHFPGLLRKALFIQSKEIHWIREDLKMELGEAREYLVRIRYRQPLQKAVLFRRSNGIYIIFKEYQRGISAGQFAAWYSVDDLEMLGSGVIFSIYPPKKH